MHSYVGLSRRKGGERRHLEAAAGFGQRGDDRRHDAHSYFLVLGNAGIDGAVAACLIAMVLIVFFVTVYAP